jgi:hypothetical protein
MRFEVWVREFRRASTAGEVPGTKIWKTEPVERFWGDYGGNQAGAIARAARLNALYHDTPCFFFLKECAQEGTQMAGSESIESGGEQR